MRNILNKAQRREIFKNFNVGPNSAMYDSAGNVIAKTGKFKTRRFIKKIKKLKKLKKLIIVTSVVLALAGAIYIPQLFIEEVRKNELIFTSDKGRYAAFLKYLDLKRDADFDGDGLSNYLEAQQRSNPFSNDTDHDGVLDSFDKNPCERDETLLTILTMQGADIEEPYAINGVILWPDNEEAWSLGAVIPVQSGYQFTDFQGWAKFPSGKYAYKFAGGKHTLLDYKQNANAWYIEEDCVVVLVDEQIENTYLISLFGYETYMRNSFGAFLAKVLPDKGWIAGETMWLEDTFVDTSDNIYAKYQTTNITQLDDSRYSTYSNKLDDLADVYRFIDQGDCVLASLMSEDHGETIVEVYGYTKSGDLIVADPHSKSTNGVIFIQANCSRALDKNNNITENSWFEYYGCGYDSSNGDLIGFFSVLSKED